MNRLIRLVKTSVLRLTSVLRRPRAAERMLWPLVLVVATLIVAWLVGILLMDSLRFAVLAPRAEAGVEAISALSKFFCALVLFLFPTERAGQRLRWIGGGFLILGCGALCFGYLEPLIYGRPDLNASVYAWLIAETFAGVLFLVGVMPYKAPRFPTYLMLALPVALVMLTELAEQTADALPELVSTDSLRQTVEIGETPVPWLTGWQWSFSMIPLTLAILAVFGAVHHKRKGQISGWLALAMVLLAGSNLYNIFWPSAYSLVLTAADMLRLALAGVVIVGGILELSRISSERATLLATEQERYHRLRELSALRADFTSMVSHELVNPIAAIGTLTDSLAVDDLDRNRRSSAIAAIKRELRALGSLVSDVRTSAEIERDDFTVSQRSVPLSDLVAEAVTFVATLPGNHGLTISVPDGLIVRADSERIAQVMRNLLSNAARYTPEDSPIELRAVRTGERVRLELKDHGPGILPDDLGLIFEKFARGRDEAARRASGTGLGLYICRKIVEAHGSRLEVESVPGEGAVFSFELEVMN